MQWQTYSKLKKKIENSEKLKFNQGGTFGDHLLSVKFWSAISDVSFFL